MQRRIRAITLQGALIAQNCFHNIGKLDNWIEPLSFRTLGATITFSPNVLSPFSDQFIFRARKGIEAEKSSKHHHTLLGYKLRQKVGRFLDYNRLCLQRLSFKRKKQREKKGIEIESYIIGKEKIIRKEKKGLGILKCEERQTERDRD